MRLCEASSEELLRALTHDDEAFCSPTRWSTRHNHMIRYPCTRPREFCTFRSRSQTSSPSTLEILPLEIFWNIASFLSFESLEKFRGLSTRTKEAVEAMTEYKDIVRHAAATLKALDTTGLISCFTTAQLHMTLTSSQCFGCNNCYGPYLFLPTCTRVCFNCLEKNPSMRVIPCAAETQFGLIKKVMRKLSPIKLNYRTIYVREFISATKARELGIKLHGSEEQMLSEVRTLAMIRKETLLDVQAQFDSCEEDSPTIIKMKLAIEEEWEYSLRFEASTPFPYLNRQGGTITIDHGLWCLGCEVQMQPTFEGMKSLSDLQYHQLPYLWREKMRSYTREEILQHFTECPGVEKAWKAHEERMRKARLEEVRLEEVRVEKVRLKQVRLQIAQLKEAEKKKAQRADFRKQRVMKKLISKKPASPSKGETSEDEGTANLMRSCVIL